MVLLNLVFALLNIGVAALLESVRPRRLANHVAALMFALNGVQALSTAVLRWNDYVGAPQGDFADRLNIALNGPTWAAFIVFPFLFPRRRLTPRAERVLLGGAAAWALGIVALAAVGPAELLGNNPAYFWTGIYAFPVFFAGLSVGALLLLDTYLGSPSEIQRNQARYILAAYVVKAGAVFTVPPLAAPLEGAVNPPLPLLLAGIAFLTCAIAAPVIAIVASRLQGHARERSLGEDLFVLVFVALAFNSLPRSFNLSLDIQEYFLLRPILFAYAILRYQLLEVDVRARRGLVATTLLAGVAAVFMLVGQHLTIYGVPPWASAGVALLVTLGVGGLLAWPLVRWLLPSPEAPGDRSRELYRAALEEAVAANPGHDSTQDRVLRALRAKLAISDREHAVMESAVRASFGKPSEGVAAGQRFLGRYRVEKLLGEGGFGRTFLAHDEQVGRQVVLKAARVADEVEAKRLLREARIVARLHHPGIVTVFDVEQVAGDVFLVMEYVDGGSLAERLRGGAMAWRDTLPVVDDVLGGLEAAHAGGVLHRDLKPANILLTRQGRAKLADFGVAKAPAGSGTVGGLSTDGVQPGSVPYMSPEQVRGKGLDARSDLYALGVVWYEMLAGGPYLNLKGRAEFDMRLAILEEAPKLPLPGIPAGVNALLGELLAKAPERRPASAGEVRDRLRAMASERTRSAPGPQRRNL